MNNGIESVERWHWVNALVGVLDSAFYLGSEEILLTSTIVGDLLEKISVPERGVPSEVPPALYLEVTAGVFSSALAVSRPELPRTRTTSTDAFDVSLSDWCDALARMLFRAYPDLRPEERLFVNKMLSDMLAALGIPTRKPLSLPEEVIAVYGESR